MLTPVREGAKKGSEAAGATSFFGKVGEAVEKGFGATDDVLSNTPVFSKVWVGTRDQAARVSREGSEAINKVIDPAKLEAAETKADPEAEASGAEPEVV